MSVLRRHLLPLLIWTLALLAIYGPLALGARALPSSDLTDGMYPYAVFQAREMQAGRLPVWSPGSYGGHPFAADPQSAVIYPLRLLTLLLAPASGLPVQFLFLEAIVHLWLAGAFMYALATDITGRREAGLLAAVAWGLGGYVTGYPVLQLPVLESIIWLPLTLLFLRRAAHAPRPVAWLSAAALALACCAWAGHPQTLMHVSYLSLAYYLFSTWRAGWSWRWIGAGVVLFGGLALGLAAPVWLPALDYLPLTERAGAGYDFVRSGFPLQDYLQVLVPNSLTAWAPQYIGVGALMLAGLALAHRVSMPARPRYETSFWLGVLVAACLLSLGDDGILFAAGYRLFPGWSLFRGQERWVSLFSCALAILAAMGCAVWLRDDRGIIRRRSWQVVLASAAALALAGLMLALIAGDAGAAWLPLWGWAWALLVLYGVFLLVPLSRRRRAPRPQSAAFFLLLLAVDVAVVAIRVTPAVAPYDIAHDGWSSMLQAAGAEQPVARVDSSGLLAANLGELYGIEDIWGVSPLRPAALGKLRALPRLRLYSLLDVSMVLSQSPLDEPGLEHVADIPPETLWLQDCWLFLYRNTAPHARAWMVHSLTAVNGQQAALEAVRDPGLDPMTMVILEGPVVESQDRVDGAEEEVAVERVSPSELHLTVQAASAGYLVISEWYAGGLLGSGWRASVDGNAVPIRRADYALQAIAMPAGEHTVRLWYTAPAVWAGVAIGGLSLLTALVLASLRGRWLVTRRPQGSAMARNTPTLAGRQWPLPVVSERWPLILWLLVLVGLGLRLFRLGTQELRGDEALSYLIALGSPRQIVTTLLDMGDPHSPLHYLMLHATMMIGGVSEFVMRFPSALLGVALIPVAWGIGRVSGGPRRGLMLAALAALAEPLVWVGQDLRSQYVVAVLGFGLATWILLRLGERPSRIVRPGLWWLAYTLCAALSVYAFYYAALALLGHVAYVLAHRDRRRLVLPWAVSVLAAMVLFAPWVIAGHESLLASGQLSDPDAPEMAPFMVESVTHLTAGETWSRSWVRGIAAAALVLAVLGARSLWRRDRALAALALTTVVATVLALYLVRHVRATYEPRYLLCAILPWWLLVIAGIEHLLDHWSPVLRHTGLFVLVALIGLNVISVTRYHADPAYTRTVGYRAAAAYLAEQAQPGDAFVRNAPDPCWDYYLRGLDLPREMVPSQGLADAATVASELETLGERYDRLWFSPNINPAWDPQGAAGHWLEHNMLLDRHARLNRVDLAGYRPLRTALAEMLAAGEALSNGIVLEAYALLLSGSPVDTDSVPAWAEGDTLDVTLAWRPARVLEQDYTMFVHLVSDDGALLAQHDGPPLLGTRPTTYWEPGEFVLDRHTLALPAMPAGDLRLHIGMYDSETVIRERWLDGSDVRTISLSMGP